METTKAKSVRTEADIFSQAVINKSYSVPPSAVNPDQLKSDIPEARFTPPPSSVKTDDPFVQELRDKEQKEMEKDAKRYAAPPIAANPQLHDLSDNKKEEAAAVLAKVAMDAYGWLNKGADNLLKISDRKILKLQQKGEIDLKVPVPYNALGEEMPLGAFIQEYNEQTKGTFTVDPEFRAEVEPILTRVLAKHGHGMSDEQNLLFLFGQDLVGKTIMFFNMKRNTNDILNFAKDQSAARNRPQQAYAPPPAPQQQPVYQGPPPPAGAPTPLDLQNQHAPGNYVPPPQPVVQPVPEPTVVSTPIADLSTNVEAQPQTKTSTGLNGLLSEPSEPADNFPEEVIGKMKKNVADGLKKRKTIIPKAAKVKKPRVRKDKNI